MDMANGCALTKPAHASGVTLLSRFRIEAVKFPELSIASAGERGYGPRMSITAEDSAVIVKTREFCAQIASDPMFCQLQERIERFLNDEAARLQYQSIHERGEELHQKQHAGIQLGASEVREFEAAREALLENEVAREFIAAQQQLENLQKVIRKTVALTLELGRVPTAADLAEAEGGGCCGGGGGGCGCSH
jgi:cell fate (sporulation/competence/biofilm development) regulator YlbF (YheA/YmcA/DUF963 family)